LNPLKQLAGQTAIYGLSSVVARILNFLLVPFYTRVFTDTAEYGIVNELYAYVAFLIIVLTYGMETAFFRFSSKSKNPNIVFSTALLSILITTFIFILVIVGFYPSFANLLGYGERQEFILLLGLVLAFDAIAAIPFSRLRLENKAFKFAVIKIFNVGINIFFNVLFLIIFPYIVEQKPGIPLMDLLYHDEFRVGYVFVSNFIASFLTLGFFVKDIIRTRFRFSAGLWKKMILYSVPLLIAGLAGTVNEVIDRVMLKFRLPENIDALEQIGIYGANVKIAVIMTLFIQMFRYASEPFFFSHEKRVDNKKLYSEILHYFTLTGSFIFLIVCLYLDLFKYIIGENYHEGLNVVPIILLGNLMLGIYFNFSVWYKLKDITIFGTVFALAGAVVTLVINYYFIPLYGYNASAWGHLIAYTLMAVLSYTFGKFYYPIPYNVRMVFLYIFFAVIIYLISSVIKIDQIFYRLVINTLLLLVFIVIVLIVEKDKIKRIFARS
jgi:O-antigen/teichoic acid export membrane protein